MLATPELSDHNLLMASRYKKKPAPPSHDRICNHVGCDEPGDHPAPKSPQEMNDTKWFCMAHIREYNRAWNFFKGMSADEIEAYQHSTNTWHRPTWTMGVNGGGDNRVVYTMNGAHDDFGLFASARSRFDFTQGPKVYQEPKITGPVKKALETMNLAPNTPAKDIKFRYKELAKRFHPDLNGGSKTAEETLKNINLAYSLLVSSCYA